MDVKDVLSLIITIGDDVWKNWGYLITLNVAVLGWLMQRHGLYNLREKTIATLGYSGFIAVLVMGMNNAYSKLDMAANELAYVYVKSSSMPPKDSLSESFVEKSPKYCEQVLGQRELIECKPYSQNLYFANGSIFLSWLFNIVLFWYQGFWLAIRESEKNA